MVGRLAGCVTAVVAVDVFWMSRAELRQLRSEMQQVVQGPLR